MRMAPTGLHFQRPGSLNPVTYLSGQINENRRQNHSDAALMKIVASALTVPITGARTVD